MENGEPLSRLGFILRWTGRQNVRNWHKADMLNALTNVRFWSKADSDQPLLTNLDL
jgi:hypothetical protein